MKRLAISNYAEFLNYRDRALPSGFPTKRYVAAYWNNSWKMEAAATSP